MSTEIKKTDINNILKEMDDSVTAFKQSQAYLSERLREYTKKYGVLTEKSKAGKEYMRILRRLF